MDLFPYTQQQHANLQGHCPLNAVDRSSPQVSTKQAPQTQICPKKNMGCLLFSRCYPREVYVTYKHTQLQGIVIPTAAKRCAGDDDWFVQREELPFNTDSSFWFSCLSSIALHTFAPNSGEGMKCRSHLSFFTLSESGQRTFGPLAKRDFGL